MAPTLILKRVTKGATEMEDATILPISSGHGEEK